MLEKKILATNTVYTCIDHDKKVLENYFENLNDIIHKIGLQIDKNNPIDELLKGPVSKSGFYRLN